MFLLSCHFYLHFCEFFPVIFSCCTQAGKGGELTHDETTIIAGALELTEKKAGDAMTPISDIFAVDINAKLDRCKIICIFMRKKWLKIPF